MVWLLRKVCISQLINNKAYFSGPSNSSCLAYADGLIVISISKNTVFKVHFWGICSDGSSFNNDNLRWAEIKSSSNSSVKRT